MDRVPAVVRGHLAAGFGSRGAAEARDLLKGELRLSDTTAGADRPEMEPDPMPPEACGTPHSAHAVPLIAEVWGDREGRISRHLVPIRSPQASRSFASPQS